MIKRLALTLNFWRIAPALAAALLAGAALPLSAQQPHAGSSSKLEVIPVKGNVYLIAGPGIPNITMQVGEQFVVLVDAGPADRAADIKAAIRTVTSKPIGILI